MGRIEKLCAYLDKCRTFADVGCDHGYCTQYALENGLCESAVIADISAKSLSKAQNLLSDYIADGRVKSVCCDGLEEIDQDTDEVLIAGMGGEEIIKILSSAFIPNKFVFQPMKNAPLLRKYLIERGAKIVRDDIFEDGKYYFVIKGERMGGTAEYGELETEFGKDSLKNPVFLAFARIELDKKLSYLSGCKDGADCSSLRRQADLLKEAIDTYEAAGHSRHT